MQNNVMTQEQTLIGTMLKETRACENREGWLGIENRFDFCWTTGECGAENRDR